MSNVSNTILMGTKAITKNFSGFNDSDRKYWDDEKVYYITSTQAKFDWTIHAKERRIDVAAYMCLKPLLT